jgi:hypothetical protein
MSETNRAEPSPYEHRRQRAVVDESSEVRLADELLHGGVEAAPAWWRRRTSIRLFRLLRRAGGPKAILEGYFVPGKEKTPVSLVSRVQNRENGC